MNTVPIDLTVEIRSADGTSTEFYQTDEESIRKSLRLLATPRLLTQPQLVLASEHSVTTIPCRAIDMLLVRTSAQVPLTFPAGLLDIVEMPEDQSVEDSASPDDYQTDNSESSGPRTVHVEIHTLGGWVSTFRALLIDRGTVQDQRQSLAHLFDLPLVPFRLRAGGIGLINPANMTGINVCPTPGALPETALPMQLLRWTPFQFKTPANITSQFSHDNEIR
jgi:hypothetical protein